MRRALLLSALGILVTLGASAQTAAPESNPVSEPEFANVFFRLEGGKLIPLERQTTANFHTKTSGFMVVSVKSMWEFSGAKSPVRFSGEMLEFVVRMPAQSMDPEGMYHLLRLDSKKKVREMVFVTAHGSPFGASAATAGDGLAVTFARFGTSSVKMTVKNLPPGEYAIQPATLQPVFCFGID